MSAEDTKAYFLNNGMEVAYRDPRQFTSFVTDEIKRWSNVVKTAHISLDAQK
jgi:tripartite-type tricarboxylate transporter receptor subunit TctC